MVLNFIKIKLLEIFENPVDPGFFKDFVFFIVMVLVTLFIIICVLIYTAFVTLFERKTLGGIQKRKGPNVVGFLGLLQAISDGVKLFLKETLIPGRANRFLFMSSPIVVFFVSLSGWAIIPFFRNSFFTDINLGLLVLFALSVLNVYGILIAGWSGNSRLPFLGALRSVAQMLSYDLSLGANVLTIALYTKSLNLAQIIEFQSEVCWLGFLVLPSAILFFICILAELKRVPFDLPEAESELVSGYNTEYSGFLFAFFFLAEYASLVLFANLFVILFLGGWSFPLCFLEQFFSVWFQDIISFCFYNLKVILILWTFIALRGTVARFRYDTLMSLGWKVFLPASLGWFFVAIFLSGLA